MHLLHPLRAFLFAAACMWRVDGVHAVGAWGGVPCSVHSSDRGSSRQKGEGIVVGRRNSERNANTIAADRTAEVK